jgi:hypothetical protein
MTERSEALGRDPHEHTWLDLATLSATVRIINVHNRKTWLLEG